MEQSKFYQIKNVTEHEYTLVGCDGSVITRPIQDIDRSASAFTILDAKDGDVLVTRKKSHPFIFKKYDEDTDYVYAYCGICDLVKDNSFYTDDDQLWTCYSVAGDVYPATKEQRDTLLKAMADAGYTFDFEKKELKKMEQKVAENEELTEFDKAVGVSIGTWNPKTPEQIKSVKAVSKKLLKLAKKQINDEQKPAWSEEDDEHLERILKELGSQRQRTINSPYLDKIESDYNWLKSLRPQNRWISIDKEVYVKEPILAQKKDKSDPFDGFVVCCDHTLTPNVYERYMILGNIVSQKTWKPSDEQMEALKQAKTDACGKPYFNALASLYVNLKGY